MPVGAQAVSLRPSIRRAQVGPDHSDGARKVLLGLAWKAVGDSTNAGGSSLRLVWHVAGMRSGGWSFRLAEEALRVEGAVCWASRNWCANGIG